MDKFSHGEGFDTDRISFLGFRGVTSVVAVSSLVALFALAIGKAWPEDKVGLALEVLQRSGVDEESRKLAQAVGFCDERRLYNHLRIFSNEPGRVGVVFSWGNAQGHDVVRICPYPDNKRYCPVMTEDKVEVLEGLLCEGR